MTRKRWSDLSGRQQAAIAAAATVQVALAAATLWDLRRRPSVQIRGSKKLWGRGRVRQLRRPAGLFHCWSPSALTASAS